MSELTIFVNANPVAYGPLSIYYAVIDAVYFKISLDASASKVPGSISGVESSLAELGKFVLNATKYKDDALVKEWFTFAESRITADAGFAGVTAALDELDDHLRFKTFIVGHELTPADALVWGALKGNSPAQGVLKKGLHVHLSRWFSYVSGVESATKAINAITEAKLAAVKGSKATSANFELGLPEAVQGAVVTRFPPEPSGYLHIGHAKAAIINQYFARHYAGTLIVRFDDTNPSNEKAEFQDSIIDDLKWMGVNPDKISYTSDWFQQLFDKGVELINLGKAYADDTPQEEMQEIRRAGQVPSKHRDMSKEETLAHFKEMATGSEEGQRWCLRAKIQWDSPNGAMRDPVIYRGNAEPHHRTGTKWKIYPNYDFACPIVDSMEGVTHALRSNEYRDRNPLYAWVLEALSLRRVIVWDFARLNFQYTLLSKRKLKALIDDLKVVSGWDDPRFPTIRGIRRRGMTSEALTAFMIAQGPSQAVNLQEWDVIWTTNKRIIDPIVPRHSAIVKEKSVKVTIHGAPAASVQDIPKHKKNAALGTKKTAFAPEILLEQEDVQTFNDKEEITLMDWGNAIVRGKPTPKAETLELDLHLAGDFKKTEKKIHWLSQPSTDLLNALLIEYDYIIKKEKLADDDKLEDIVNPVSEYTTEAWVDKGVGELKKGDILQLERKGYYIVDKALGVKTDRKDGGGEDRVELIFIPDGRAKSIALKAGNKVVASIIS